MKRALIIGRAVTVWEEIAAAQVFCRYDAVIVINRMGRDYPGDFQHWVSYHPELFPHWAEHRRLPWPASFMYWTGINKGKKLGEGKRLKIKLQYCNYAGGSSGLLAIKVALDGIGMDRAVLTGVPMMPLARYDDPKIWPEAEVRAYWQQWEEQKDWMAGRVRSMSGRTKDFLGEPTKEWLGC